EINFLDDFEHGLRLEGRTIETLLDRSQKLRVEGFLLQTQEFVTTGIADAHSLPPCQWLSSASITGVPFGKMVGANDEGFKAVLICSMRWWRAPGWRLTRPGIRAIRWRRRGREKFRGRKKEERHNESSASQIGKRRDHAPRIR